MIKVSNAWDAPSLTLLKCWKVAKGEGAFCSDKEEVYFHWEFSCIEKQLPTSLQKTQIFILLWNYISWRKVYTSAITICLYQKWQGQFG